MKHHTNKHLRRALALFMTVLMAMSCVSAGLVASASVSGFPTRENLDWFTASNDTMYGVDPWDGTTGKETINSTGFGSHWNTGSYTADNFCTVEYPGAIYLNVGESLQAAGYKVHMTAHYGNKRDHRIMINSLIWGETNRSGYNGVYNLIPDYDHLGTVSEGISAYPDTTTSATNFDFANDAYGANNLPSSGEGFEGGLEKMVVWRVPYDNETVYNFDEYVFLKGTAAQTGTYSFGTSGINPLIICAQDWRATFFASDAKVLKDDLTSSTVMDGQWKELRINFTVYDKTDLNKAVAYADAYYAANGEYPVKEGQTQQQFADALTQAKSVLATREVTQTQIDYAFNSICDRMTSLIIDNADTYTAGGDPFGTDANTFNAVAYHCADPATGTQNWQKTNGSAHDYEELKWGVYGNAYRNLAYAPYDQTEWIEKEWHNCYTTLATPSNIVMVYDGVAGHEPMSPIMMQLKGNGSNGPRAVDYLAVDEDVPNLVFQRQWAGYMDESNDGYKLWPDVADGRNTVTINANSYINYQVRDRNDLHRLQTENQSNKNTRRDYGNAFVYVGTGNTTNYYEQFSQTKLHYSHTWYGTSTQVDDEKIPSKGNIYVINYKPVYDKLADAAATKAIIDNADEVWKYTGASVERAKATLAVMAKANPNAYAYSDVGGDVQTCASFVEKAVYMLANDGLTLEKKSGTATFLKDDGTTEVAAITAKYGDSFTVPAVPEKEPDAQYTYSDGVWTPAATPDSAVMSDDYNKTFIASYTPNLRSYTITWNYKNADGDQSTTTSVTYGVVPTAPSEATGNYETASTAYTFNGWGEQLVAVTGEKTYTATYTEATKAYPVTITAGANTTLTVKNGDTTVNSGDEVPYGTVLTIEAALAPAYTQNGTLSVTVNDEAYTATTYTVTSATTIATAPVENVPKNTYTIIWQDQWGKELSRATVEHGWATTMPLNDPADVRIEDKVYTFSGWDNGLTGGQSVYVTEDTTITANYTLTDQVAKYTVTFLNDDNYSVIATAEYEYNAAVAVPETPVSTNRTKELDYTFTGWTPEVAATVTADATYVATYETEAHSRLYPVKWVYGNDNTVAKEANLPYNTVFTAEAIPADVITKDDDVTHNVYSWSQYSDKRLENYIGNTTTEVLIHADSSLERHTGEPAYEWVGNDADGYTKCIGTMTCTACGEVLRVEASFTQPTTTHTGENCQDRSYTSHLASLSGSGANSYFENQTKKVYGDYGPHNFSHYYTDNEPTYNWTYTDKTHVSCVASQKCYYCDAVDTETGTVSEADVQQDANCAQPEKSEYTATFERFDPATKTFETAPINSDAHDYSPYTLDEERTVRPVYDEATGTWSKATLVYNCDNTYDYDTHGYDHSHDKVVENVDRADYTAFDAAYEKFLSIAELDIADDTLVTVEQYGSTQQIPFSYVKNQVERAIDNADELPLDYTTTHTNDEWDEQQNVNNMVEQLNYFINMVFNDDGTVKDGLLNTYTITFVTDGSPVINITDAKKGDEIALPETTKDGFHFEGWYTDESHADGTKAADPYTVTGDATLYAFFEELSLSGDDVEAAIAAATAGVSGICYTEASYTAYTNAVAAVRAFKDQPATSENLAAYNNALSALDAAVAGLVAEHVYTGEPVITRPVQDAETGTWSKGVKTWTCANNADHPVKTEEVDRADYTTYDSVLEQISNLLNEDLTDDVKTALETAKTALEAIPQDYIVDEQETLDNAIQAILNTLNTNDKIDVDENNIITVDPDTAYKTYTLKIYNNVNTDYMEFTHKAGTTARLDPTLAGYTLKGFSENANYNAETGIYIFPQADDTITALFVKDLTDNETIENAQQIIADETNPDSGKDYDDDYIDDLNDLLDEINAIKDDPTKLDKLDEKLEALQTLVDKAEQNRVYTITWSIDGVETTETYKVGATPTHAAPTKEGYRFTSWDPAITAVSGDATYTAVFTEASAEPAYYAEYDAVFAKLETVPTNDKVTAELKAEAQDKLAHPLDRNLTADQQQIIDDEVAAIRAILDKIFEKDSNGNYTDDVKDGAAVKYTVVFHWLGATLTRTVVSGKGAKGPDLTRLYGVEGMEGGHFVFKRWVKDSEDSGIPADITNVTENMDVYAEYKQEAHTGAWIEHEATCTESSWAEIDCTLCGMHFTKKTDTSPELGHAWGDWVVVTAATCAHPGRQTRTCTRDASHTETAVIPQLAHTDANGDTICDVCGNPTENHQHTDVNGDGKCDTCGATTDAHVHNYQNGVCTGCGQTQDGSFRCNLCSVYEQYRHIPVAGWFLTVFHFFYHLICQITSWR